MSRFLLDTNILSDLVRKPQGKIADRIAEAGESNVFTSIIVAAELRFGARKSSSRRLMNQVDAILSALEIQPFEEPADRTYGALRVTLEKKGKAIGPNDLLIAAQALVLDSVVVTANQREFSRVPGLKVENWLRG